MYGSILQYVQVRDAAINAAADPTALTAAEETAVVTAISALAGTNELLLRLQEQLELVVQE